MSRFVFLITVVIFMNACSGTGTLTRSEIQPVIDAKQKNKVFVHRDEGWVGAGALVTILINGKKQGTLGPGEMLVGDSKYGLNYIEAKIEGLQGIGLNATSEEFENKSGANNFFITGFKVGILTNRLTLMETLESSWRKQIRNK